MPCPLSPAPVPFKCPTCPGACPLSPAPVRRRPRQGTYKNGSGGVSDVFSMVCPTHRIDWFFNGLSNGSGGGFGFCCNGLPNGPGIRFSMVRPTGLEGFRFFFNGLPNGSGSCWAQAVTRGRGANLAMVAFPCVPGKAFPDLMRLLDDLHLPSEWEHTTRAAFLDFWPSAG